MTGKELVLMVGIPASGKTSFYKDRFIHTHLRLSLDLLQTRKRESDLFEACLRLGQPLVMDNTNASALDRARFIPRGREAGFAVIGYFFESDLDACLARNSNRKGTERIRDQGVAAAWEKLELPLLSEGFDEVHSVQISAKGFKISRNRVLEPVRPRGAPTSSLPRRAVRRGRYATGTESNSASPT